MFVRFHGVSFGCTGCRLALAHSRNLAPECPKHMEMLKHSGTEPSKWLSDHATHRFAVVLVDRSGPR
jgi:hypothetical protein